MFLQICRGATAVVVAFGKHPLAQQGPIWWTAMEESCRNQKSFPDLNTSRAAELLIIRNKKNRLTKGKVVGFFCFGLCFFFLFGVFLVWFGVGFFCLVCLFSFLLWLFCCSCLGWGGWCSVGLVCFFQFTLGVLKPPWSSPRTWLLLLILGEKWLSMVRWAIAKHFERSTKQNNEMTAGIYSWRLLPNWCQVRFEPDICSKSLPWKSAS